MAAKHTYIFNTGRLVMDVIDTFKAEKYDFPFIRTAAKKVPVPMIHKIEFDYGFGLGDIPAADTYFEIYMILSQKELPDVGRINETEGILCAHAYIMWQGVAEYEITENHHGERVHYFDPPIAYPFDEIWLNMTSVNAGAVKSSGARVFYTTEDMTAEEILVAREILS